jgi:hypothetical protein
MLARMSQMKYNVTLTITSLLTILFVTFHLTDDIVYRISPGRLSNLNVVLVLVVWLYATLVLAGRRSGYVIVLVLSLLASGLPVIHMIGKSGITAGISKPAGAFFFAWTLMALGVTALFSALLAVRGLRSLRRVPAEVVSPPGSRT